MNMFYGAYGILQEVVRQLFSLAGWKITTSLLLSGAVGYVIVRFAGKLADFWMERIRFQWDESKTVRADEKASHEKQIERYQSMIENHLSASSAAQIEITGQLQEMHERYAAFSSKSIEVMKDLKDGLKVLADGQKGGFDKIEERHGEISPAMLAIKNRVEDLWKAKGGS